MRADILTATFLVAFASASAASIVYDNGAPAFQQYFAVAGFTLYGQPSGSGAHYEADSFTLTSSQTITNGIYWVYVEDINAGTPNPPNIPNGLDWWIYSNSSGAPGSPLYSGSSSETILQGGLDMNGNPEPWPIGFGYEVDFSLGNLDLGAGTYWLVLTEPNQIDSGWIDTSTVGSGCCYMENPPSGTWADRSSTFPGFTAGNELAFQLYDGDPAVPEPGSMALIGTGLVVLTFLARWLRREV